ncbi:MAG TPA: hypothetical protein VMN03_04270 [Burkholderiales bacterium]|nr:hypothetical protein [Burkholderiales bacterium]
MRSLAAIESALESPLDGADVRNSAMRLLADAELVLEHWVLARGDTPTAGQREGFRLLALHRQGARGEPSFNACRETCREIAYHYNLLCEEPGSADSAQRRRMMAMLVKHLLLFVSGKLQAAQLGEFCCSSRPLRIESA